jgi:hypothetical protein
MYYNDHNPPHFHAIYGREEAVIGIDPVTLLWATFRVGRWRWSGRPSTNRSCR